MNQIIAILDDRLAQTGSSYTLNGHLDETEYALGAHSFTLPNGIDYSLVLTNAGQGIFVNGMVRADVRATCDRCLGPACFSIASEVDEYYLFEEPDDAHMDEETDPLDYELVGDDSTINLTRALSSAILMDTPFVIHCSEDCKGLCLECGANLNTTTCPHQQHVTTDDDMRAANPFAVLSSLKDELEQQEHTDK